MDIRDTKSSILLQLFDNGVREQNFDVRLESLIVKSRNSDAVDSFEVMRFDVADVITCAAAQAKRRQQDRDEVFHSGEAVASGVGEGVGTGGRSGAVVVSGFKEVGGGSDSSVSGGGSGATSPGDVRMISEPR